MGRDNLILLLIVGGAAYWFLFRKTDSVKQTAVQAPPTANPSGGKTQEANNGTFDQVLGLFKSVLDTINNANNNAAQSSANRNG